MTPSVKWLLWALGLLALVCVVDFVAFGIGASMANARSVREAGDFVLILLAGYLACGLAATALLWSRGAGVGAGMRTVGTIAFLVLQGLVFAFMSLMTLLGTNR